MNDAIRITSPADILGFIPHALGFAPRESFVFVTLRGNTLGATLRVDAPVTGDPSGFARAMLEYIALDTHATAVLLAIYTGETPEAGEPRPFHEHVEALIGALEAAGTPLKDAWLVTAEHWQNLLCDPDAGCCGPEPLESITDGQLNAEMVFRGSSYQKQPGTSYAAFTGPADTAQRIREALPGALASELGAGRALWAKALAGNGFTNAETTVQLLACFQRPDLRDVLFCNVIEPERPDAEGSGDLLTGQGIAPDWNRVDRAQDTARVLIDAAPEGYRAALLTLIGWLAYLKGQSSVAADHFAAALADAPGYRLAELMDELVSRGTIAPVAKDEHTSSGTAKRNRGPEPFKVRTPARRRPPPLALLRPPINADAGAAPGTTSKHPPPGYSGKATATIHARSGTMSHDFVLTDDDAAPAGATQAQDVLELSMLTLDQGSSVVDLSWEKSPLDQ